MKQVFGLAVLMAVILAGVSIWYRGSNFKSALMPAQSISSEETVPPTAQGDSIIDKFTKPPAPNIVSDTWLNSPALTPADLRGQVVVVEFWTFG